MVVYDPEELKEISEKFSVKHLLKNHAYLNLPLNFDESYLLGVYALLPHITKLRDFRLFPQIDIKDGEEKGILSVISDFPTKKMKNRAKDVLVEKQALALMCSLHTKATYFAKPSMRDREFHLAEYEHCLPEDASEQIAGISAAIFDYDIACSVNGFLSPKVNYAIDNCGMGGDMLKTPNISTLSAIIAAGANIPMCKHGSPGNTDRHGSSDFVAMILNKKGFDELIGIPKEVVEAGIEEHCFGYTEALDTSYKRVHILTHRASFLPHMNDIIGPMTNPLHKSKAKRKIVGVNHLIPPEIVAKAFKILNERGVTDLEHGLFVRGYADEKMEEGIDELSIMRGGSLITELKNGEIIGPYKRYARDFGIREVEYEEINPHKNKGEFSRNILFGNVNGGALEIVLANTALIFYLQTGKDLRECYNLARDAFESKRCLENLKEINEHFK